MGTNKRFNTLTESELSIIGGEITIRGTLEIKNEFHFYGKLFGEIQGNSGSILIIKEGAYVEGKITADTLIVDGFIHGQIECTQKIWVTELGRVSGTIRSPSVQVDPGAVFEAKVTMSI